MCVCVCVTGIMVHIYRSVSAQPLARDEEVDYVDLDARDGVMRHLKDQFHSYSRLGDRRSDGSHISCSQSDKWLKQVAITKSCIEIVKA